MSSRVPLSDACDGDLGGCEAARQAVSGRSQESARMNPRGAADEDHDTSRPLDDMPHQQERRKPRQELMPEPIAQARLGQSLYHEHIPPFSCPIGN
jgi:hypothetical protein